MTGRVSKLLPFQHPDVTTKNPRVKPGGSRRLSLGGRTRRSVLGLFGLAAGPPRHPFHVPAERRRVAGERHGARERRPDLYLLADIDIDWVADGIRDRGHMRETMQKLFLGAVIASGAPYAVVAGSREARWQLATYSVDAIIAGKTG